MNDGDYLNGWKIVEIYLKAVLECTLYLVSTEMSTIFKTNFFGISKNNGSYDPGVRIYVNLQSF
tara:strand:- start:305 stop:496 length:192 start_codon:yes stop_codon:yes gene_type:complete